MKYICRHWPPWAGVRALFHGEIAVRFTIGDLTFNSQAHEKESGTEKPTSMGVTFLRDIFYRFSFWLLLFFLALPQTFFNRDFFFLLSEITHILTSLVSWISFRCGNFWDVSALGFEDFGNSRILSIVWDSFCQEHGSNYNSMEGRKKKHGSLSQLIHIKLFKILLTFFSFQSI